MNDQTINYDAIMRDAKRLRARAIADFWQQLTEKLSPRLPKLFPAEF